MPLTRVADMVPRTWVSIGSARVPLVQEDLLIARRIASLFAALAVAVGLSLTAPGPATAADRSTPEVSVLSLQTCQQNYPTGWQINSVGTNKTMASCFVSWLTPTTFNAVTRIWTNSFWTGYHGCVKLQFFQGTTLIGESSTQRWGVSADSWREILWSSTAPSGYYDRTQFAHWRC